MTYQETLSYIYGLGRFGIKPGLERISAALGELGNPQEGLKAVQIVGTNGKGSTAAFLASILAQVGYRVGLFTSPHLISFTERIQINGVQISEEEVTCLAARVIQAAPAGTTFFEIVTAMAILHFAEQGVDIAILEAGMGGRNDASNVVDGMLAIVTPISLDHCEYLGDSITAIAADKGGIIKPGRPVVISAQSAEASRVLIARAAELGAARYRFGQEFSLSWQDEKFSYHGIQQQLVALQPSMIGCHQGENAASALAAAELLHDLGYPVTIKAMQNGIANTFWPGRLEFLGNGPRFLLDGAHNAAGTAALVTALQGLPRQRLLLVLGLMGDKDLDAIAGPLLSQAEQVYAVAPALQRALPVNELVLFCQRRGVSCIAAGSVANGLAEAAAAARTGDLILVTGSLFTVGEARAELLERHFEPFRG